MGPPGLDERDLEIHKPPCKNGRARGTKLCFNMVFAQDGVTMRQCEFRLKSVDYADLGISTLEKSFCWLFLSFHFFRQCATASRIVDVFHVDTGLSAFCRAADFSTGIWDIWA